MSKRKASLLAGMVMPTVFLLTKPRQAQGKQRAREQRIRIQRSRKADPVCAKGRDTDRAKRAAN